MNLDRTFGGLRLLASFSAFVALPLAVAAPGCDAILGIEDLSASGTGGNTQFQCELPTDCPGAGNACFTRDCVGGVCEVSELGTDQPVSSQVDGDCKIVLCNSDGTTREDPDTSDLPNDSLECTDDTCGAGGPVFTPKAAGSPCSTGVCSSAGECVECVGLAQCSGGKICIMNQCVSATCGDQMKNGDETDKDCGGSCPPCVAGKACKGNADCVTLVCVQDQCQQDACDDMVQNGNETDVDCGGGDCNRCEHDKKCMDAADCQSGVCDCPAGMPNCTQQVCQVASCTDGVKNGTEVAVDCGAMCLGQCQTDDPCQANSWCLSLVCDVNNNKCLAPTCMDGVKNGTETMVDCGGLDCDPCG